MTPGLDYFRKKGMHMKRIFAVLCAQLCTLLCALLCALPILGGSSALAAPVPPTPPTSGHPILVIGPGFSLDAKGQMLTQGNAIDIGLRAVPGSNPQRYEFFDKATGRVDIYDFTVRYMQPGDRFILTFRYKLEPVAGLDLSVPTAVWLLCRQIEDRNNPSSPIYIPLNAGERDGDTPGPRDDRGQTYTLGNYPPNLADKFQFRTYSRVFRAGQAGTEADAIRTTSGRVPGSILDDASDAALLSALSAATPQTADWLSVWNDRALSMVSLSEGDVVYLYYYGRWDGDGYVSPGTKGAKDTGAGFMRDDNDYMAARIRLEWQMGIGAEELVVTPPAPPAAPTPPTDVPPTIPTSATPPSASPTPTTPSIPPPASPSAPTSAEPPPDVIVTPSKPPLAPPTPGGGGEIASPTGSPGDRPKTGDDYNLTIWIALIIISATVLYVLLICGKRRRGSKED